MRTHAALVALALATLVGLGCSPPAEPGVPVGAPQVVCQGVPQAACRQAFDVVGTAPGTIARVVVRCSLPVCTEANGEAEVTVFFLDGRQETSGYGWASAPGMPVFPPEPPASG